jgi:hypothetical protein
MSERSNFGGVVVVNVRDRSIVSKDWCVRSDDRNGGRRVSGFALFGGEDVVLHCWREWVRETRGRIVTNRR